MINVSFTYLFLQLCHLFLNSDGTTAVMSISKAEFFAQTISENSTLDDSRHISPTHNPSDFAMIVIAIFKTYVCRVLSGLHFRKAYGATCPQNYADIPPDHTMPSSYILPSSCSLAGMPTYSLCLRRVTTLVHLTNVLKLYFPVLYSFQNDHY